MILSRTIGSLPVRAKVAIGLVMLAAFLGLFSLYVGGQYREATRPVSGLLTESLGRDRASTLSLIADIEAKPLRDALRDSVLADAVNTLAQSADPAEMEAARRYLNQQAEGYLASRTNYRQVRFISTDGAVLFALPRTTLVTESDAAYFRALRTAPDFRGVYFGPLALEPDPAIDMATPLLSEGRRVGYMVIRLDPTNNRNPQLPSLFSQLAPVRFQGGNIIFYLINVTGQLEATDLRPLALTTEQAVTVANLRNDTSMTSRTYVSPINNRPVTGFTVAIPSLNRILVAEAQVLLLDRAGEAGQFLVELALLTLAGFGLLVLVGLLYDGFIMRPIRQVSNLAMRAAQGRPVMEGDTLSQRDEIGSISKSLLAAGALNRQEIRTLELRISQRTREIDAAREIGQLIFNIRDVDTLLRRVIDIFPARFEDVYYAGIFMVDATGQLLVLRAASGEIGVRLIALGYRLAVNGPSGPSQAASTGSPVTLIGERIRLPEDVLAFLGGSRAQLTLPLRTRDSILGVLDLHSRRAEAFSETEVRLMQTIADQLAIAIINARLFQESEARLAEIEELNRRMLADAWRGYEVSRQRTHLRRPDALTAPLSENWTPLQLQAVQTGQLVSRQDGDIVTFAVPIALRGQIFGAVEWAVPRSSFSENTRLLAKELAARLAVAADNARLIEQSQRLAERERLVNAIGDQLSRQSNVSTILQLAVKELGQALRVPNTTIRLATMPTMPEPTPENPPSAEPSSRETS
jgi:GAF domain-containing protein